MTETSEEALARLGALAAALGRSVKLRSPSADMVAKLGIAEAPPAQPLAATLDLVRARLRAGGRDPHDLRLAPWILWNGEPPAVAFRGLLDRVVQEAASRRRTLRNLIEAWLRDFRRDAPKITEAGLAIERLLTLGSNDRLDSWRAAHRRFRMFHADVGPAEIARDVIAGTTPVHDLLESMGFLDPARCTSGYLRAVHDDCLRKVGRILGEKEPQNEFERLTEILLLDEKLRFGDAQRGIARTLLRPWVQGSGLGAAQQALVRSFVLRHVGDPRLRPRPWVGLEPESAVLRRWLAQLSLKHFFELVGKHALDHQWRYREAFWSACLKKGIIADAWLALGNAVFNDARMRKDLGDAFGRLSGASADHSVLLMRVGSLTFAEWSHNGALRYWPSNKAPALFERYYTRSSLVDGEHGKFRHAGSESGVWQQKIASIIRKETGINVAWSDWNPK